jgi:hypothetical protein
MKHNNLEPVRVNDKLFSLNIMEIFRGVSPFPFGRVELAVWLIDIQCARVNGRINPAVN